MTVLSGPLTAVRPHYSTLYYESIHSLLIEAPSDRPLLTPAAAGWQPGQRQQQQQPV